MVAPPLLGQDWTMTVAGAFVDVLILSILIPACA